MLVEKVKSFIVQNHQSIVTRFWHLNKMHAMQYGKVLALVHFKNALLSLVAKDLYLIGFLACRKQVLSALGQGNGHKFSIAALENVLLLQ